MKRLNFYLLIPTLILILAIAGCAGVARPQGPQGEQDETPTAKADIHS